MNRATIDRLVARLANPGPDDYFCPVPFNHLYNDNAGRWRLCCRAQPFAHTISDTTPAQHLNHPLMKRIRKEMVNGKPDLVLKYCSKCIRMERAGLLSVRLQGIRKLLALERPEGNTTLRAAARVARGWTGRMPTKERCLELKLRIFGNHCNLRCYMCPPINSSSRLEELGAIRDGYWLKRLAVTDRYGFFKDDAAYDRFVDDTLRILPLVKKIRITGGEPFLLKKHYDFLEKVVATGQAGEISLVYDSNLTAFQLGSRHVTDYLQHFRRVTIYVSIDNIGPKNDYIRHGSHFGKLMENVALARSMPNIEVAVNSATGMLNAGDVCTIADFFESMNLGTGFLPCVINKPSFVQARHLPDALKQEYLGRLANSRHRDKFEGLEKALNQPRDEAEFQTFLTYIRDLDAKRGTNFLDLWPEFAPYVTA